MEKKFESFRKECKEGEVLCFSYMSVEPNDIDVVENALLFMQKPRLNDSHKDRYDYATPLHFLLHGRCSKMKIVNATING